MPVQRSSLSNDANIEYPHLFFHIKNDGEQGQLRLKCRLLPHGNENKDKDLIQKESSTAQFPIIRVILSLAAILCVPLATIVSKGAYVQVGKLNHEIFMIPPKGWERQGLVRQILVPTYGIFKSGRL